MCIIIITRMYQDLVYNFKAEISGTGSRSIVNIIIIRYINLYSEPGIEATACARELLYVYVLFQPAYSAHDSNETSNFTRVYIKEYTWIWLHKIGTLHVFGQKKIVDTDNNNNFTTVLLFTGLLIYNEWPTVPF